MTAQIRFLCSMADPPNPVPNNCQCTNPLNEQIVKDPGRNEEIQIITPEVPTEASVLKLWACNPVTCKCLNNKVLPVMLPRLVALPDEKMKRSDLIQRAIS